MRRVAEKEKHIKDKEVSQTPVASEKTRVLSNASRAFVSAIRKR